MQSAPYQSAAAMPSAATRVAARILLAEDDEVLVRFLERLLRAENYQVKAIGSGSAVLTELDSEIDLLLLDLNLPDLDGLSLLRRLRVDFAQLPILVLTGRSRSDGLLAALDSGADDCLLKPFSYLELLARIRALLRRVEPPLNSTSQCADLVLNRTQPSVARGDRRIELTQREFALLEYLMRTPDVPIPRGTLLEQVWGTACEGSTNVVDVYIKYLRDKVDQPGLPRLVRTVRGTGYMVSAA